MAVVERLSADPLVHRIVVPMPNNPLRELNVHVVRDGDACLVIDTGFNCSECEHALTAGLSELGLSPADCELLVTHEHADHSGLASSLPWRRVLLHELTFESVRGGWSGGWERIQYDTLREDGFTHEQALVIAAESAPTQMSSREPFEPTFVEDGDEVAVGRWRFRALLTPGHAPGHLCLYLPERELLFCGDHILFDISPNVSHWTGDENPLGDYLANLRAVRDLPVSLALPGHRTHRASIAGRVDELLAHHAARLEECLGAVRERSGATAVDLAGAMSWAHGRQYADMPPTQQLFAAGEARAHAEHLVREGVVARETDGLVFRYVAS